jgi:hypothetical protein
MDLNGIYSKIAGFIGGQENGASTYSGDEDKDTGVPASADIYVPLEYDEYKIDYGGMVEEDGEQAANSSNGEETTLDSSSENETTLDSSSENETTHDSSSENEATSDNSKENISDDSKAKKVTGENTAKSVALAIPVSGVMSSSFGEGCTLQRALKSFTTELISKQTAGYP